MRFSLLTTLLLALPCSAQGVYLPWIVKLSDEATVLGHANPRHG